MTSVNSFFNRFNIVKQIPIFAKLNWFDLQKIARKAIIVDYKKGDIICKEGSPPDFFYCLISGRLQAYTGDPSGKKDNIEFIHRGRHFGIISVLTGENHSFNFEAINDSAVLKIPKNDFQAILKSVPQLGVDISESLSKRIRRKVKGTSSVFESTIISIYSPVKGTGSSTYAVNLALNLEKETKKKVILVNIQSQQNREENLPSTENQATPKWTGHPVSLNEIANEHDNISGSVIKGDLKIDLLNVTFDPDDASLQKEISPLVSALVNDYHYVVVDLPNNMDHVVLEALTQADLVHLITSDRRKDLDLIRNVIDRLEQNLKENFREEKIKVIIRAQHNKIYLSFEEINRFIDYPVYTNLPLIQAADLNVDVNVKNLSFTKCHDRSDYHKVVTHIAREIGEVLVGLVLGGGAALGVAHIGVIRVLEQENIPVDIVVGSSMGALIASFWANGKTPDELEAAAKEFEKQRDIWKLFDPFIVPIAGLIGDRAIKRWLRKHLGNATFYSTKIPLKIVTYDLIRREEVVINSGSLVEAVRKSIAIPGVIEPIKLKDQILIDGGVLNPLPTNVLTSRGIKKIIAVNVLQTPEEVSEGFDIMKHQSREQEQIPFFKSPWKYLTFRFHKLMCKALNPNIPDIIVRTLQASEYVIAEQSAQQADVVIHPDLVGINWHELNRADDLIKNGEEATRKLLPQIKKLIEE